MSLLWTRGLLLQMCNAPKTQLLAPSTPTYPDHTGICSIVAPHPIEQELRDVEDVCQTLSNSNTLILRPPSLILPTNHHLIHLQPILHNLPPIHQIILLDPPPRLLLIPRDPRLDMPAHKPAPRDLKLHLDEPLLVHQRRRLPPRAPVQTEVVPLEQHHPHRRRDRDVVLHGVFDRVVERRRVQRRALRRQRLPQLLDQLQEGLAVEGEGGAAARVRGVRVRHRGQLRPREVVAVHGDEGGDAAVGGAAAGGGGGVEGVDAGGYDGGEGGFT